MAKKERKRRQQPSKPKDRIVQIATVRLYTGGDESSPVLFMLTEGGELSCFEASVPMDTCVVLLTPFDIEVKEEDDDEADDDEEGEEDDE